MEKASRSDVAAFPELFGGIDQLVDEIGQGIRRASFRLAIAAIPSGALVMFALGRLA